MTKVKSAENSSIKGIFFDYGGVIEAIEFDENTFDRGINVIRDILYKNDISIKNTDLKSLLVKGKDSYEEWYKENNFKELPNEDIWTQFVLSDYCKDKNNVNKIKAISEKLSSVYEYYLFKRRLKNNTKSVLKALSYSGYTLSVISNTISRTLIPERLKKFEILKLFTSIALSVNTGYRKPRREIFEIALKETGLKSNQCMYIGDKVLNDIQGSINAGFSKSVLIRSEVTEIKDSDYCGIKIEGLNDIFDILG